MAISKSNKALIIITAIAAFSIGLLLKSQQQTTDDIESIDIDIVLNAQLLKHDQTNQLVSEHLGKLTLINFWASWCAPCRDEMPLFEASYQQAYSQGFQIIGIAIDSPEKTQAMLDSMGITYPILYAEQTGMQLLSAAGNSQGLLPYSLLVDAQGKVITQRLGKIEQEEMQTLLKKYL